MSEKPVHNDSVILHGWRPMPSTLAKTLLAEWREPSGFIVFHDDSPDGSRRSATKVDGIGLAAAVRSERSRP